jgi:hypothetical protein
MRKVLPKATTPSPAPTQHPAAASAATGQKAAAQSGPAQPVPKRATRASLGTAAQVK